MTAPDSPIVAERINMAKACAITGLQPRRMQQKSERDDFGDIAIKIDGLWTFDEIRLRAWVKAQGEAQCQARKAAKKLEGGRGDDARDRATSNGATASPGAARGSRASFTGGRYERAMQTLQGGGSRRTSHG